MSSKTKKPKHKENPLSRTPTNIVEPISYDSKPVRFRFDLLDFDHTDWGWNNVSKEDFLEFLEFLKGIDKTTWAELKAVSKKGHYSKGNKHHDIEIHKFANGVKERLNELNLQRNFGDTLFSMAVGSSRIYGDRDSEFFRPIWHDPYHERGNEKSAYPLDKK